VTQLLNGVPTSKSVVAPLLQKPALPLLALVHPVGDNSDCSHVLVNSENEVDVTWGFVLDDENGYTRETFSYDGVNQDIEALSGTLNIPVGTLGTQQTVTLANYTVSLVDFSKGDLPVEDSFVVGSVFTTFIPYKAPTASTLTVDAIAPVSYNTDSNAVKFTWTRSTAQGLTTAINYNVYYFRSDETAEEAVMLEELGVLTEIDSIFYLVMESTVPTGYEYKFFVRATQTYEDDNCSFNVSTDSTVVTKTAQQLSGPVDITITPKEYGMEEVSMGTDYVVALTNYNEYDLDIVRPTDESQPEESDFVLTRSDSADETPLTFGDEPTVVPVEVTVASTVFTVTPYLKVGGNQGEAASTDPLSPITNPEVTVDPLTLTDAYTTITGTWDSTESSLWYKVTIEEDGFPDGRVLAIPTLTQLKTVTLSQLNTVAFKNGSIYILAVTPYLLKNGLYYEGLTDTSSILFRGNPVISLSFAASTLDTNEEGLNNYVVAYPKLELRGNTLISARFKRQVSGSPEAVMEVSDISVAEPNTTAVRDALNATTMSNNDTANLTDFLLGKATTLYVPDQVFKNYIFFFEATYSYVDGEGVTQTVTIKSNPGITYAYYKRPTIQSVIFDLGLMIMFIKVTANNSRINDIMSLITASDDPQYANDDAGIVPVLFYKFKDIPGNATRVPPIDVNYSDGDVGYNIPVNVVPQKALVILSNKGGMTGFSQNFV
jgi:hypothetical protein